MKYEDPACAYCPPAMRACWQGESDVRSLGFCPVKVDPETVKHAHGAYADPEIREVSRVAAVVESEGYCKWCRVEEIVQFAKKMGLCIGHDSLFFKYAKGLTTVLVAKGRVLAHNPVAALHLADSYYSRMWGPDKPKKPPSLPVAGRRKGPCA